MKKLLILITVLMLTFTLAGCEKVDDVINGTEDALNELITEMDEYVVDTDALLADIQAQIDATELEHAAELAELEAWIIEIIETNCLNTTATGSAITFCE